jgi:hypothetical protein
MCTRSRGHLSPPQPLLRCHSGGIREHNPCTHDTPTTASGQTPDGAAWEAFKMFSHVAPGYPHDPHMPHRVFAVAARPGWPPETRPCGALQPTPARPSSSSSAPCQRLRDPRRSATHTHGVRGARCCRNLSPISDRPLHLHFDVQRPPAGRHLPLTARDVRFATCDCFLPLQRTDLQKHDGD